ncbi:DnaD domain protein [Enterococcus gallinarum]|uniref:DnaD domain-containing protein n=1 Tax=Enterococcus gallinarum TaxID=1353 RepID=UPI001AD75030|nr:DnaD domain protein [Enterococcus gallinarum]MBO6419925.1 DnaD domain protein [Enterococcus gallinarum]MBO6423555.1 DnaD domain protein [Enterococcus gallinarum]
MAIYRQLHTTFWKDKRVGEWSREQKLFFMYLLTNDYTTQCGVYEFNRRYAKFELDLSEDEIKRNIDFLVSEGRIVFNEKSEELMIVNWLKYNSARSPKVAAVIDKELKEIKTLEFAETVIMKCQEYGYPIKTEKPNKNTVSIGYGYGIDTISQPTQHITNTEPSPSSASAQSAHGAREDTAAAAVGPNPYQLYQEVFGVLNGLVADDIKSWVQDLGEEMVCEAMKRAAFKQKSYGYAKGIMQKWVAKNIKTMAQVKADDVRHENQSSYTKQAIRTEPIPEWLDDPEGYNARKEAEIKRKAEVSDEEWRRFLDATDDTEEFW